LKHIEAGKTENDRNKYRKDGKGEKQYKIRQQKDYPLSRDTVLIV